MREDDTVNENTMPVDNSTLIGKLFVSIAGEIYSCQMHPELRNTPERLAALSGLTD